MWTKRVWRVLVLGLVLAVTTTAVAFAKPPKEKPPKPGEDVTWTCVARARNGASAWAIGEWVGDTDEVIDYYDRESLEGDPETSDPIPAYYRSYNAAPQSGVPACFDIHPAHRGVGKWLVEWNADEFELGRGRQVGLLMWFEEEVHDGLLWEGFATTGTSAEDPNANGDGAVEVTIQGTPPSLVFVAMPGRSDTWVFGNGHLVVTPVP